VRGETAVTPARSLLVAVAALALLIGARPMAGPEQFPRGLMASAEPRAGRICTIETRPLSFGIYDPLAETDLDATAQIIYTCATGSGGGGGDSGRGRGGGGGGGGGGNSPQAVRIELWQGLHGSFVPRTMTGPGAATLDYNIYLDATHRTIWGNGVDITQVYTDTHPPNATPVIVPAFGRIFGRQNVESGQYFDSVHAVILF